IAKKAIVASTTTPEKGHIPRVRRAREPGEEGESDESDRSDVSDGADEWPDEFEIGEDDSDTESPPATPSSPRSPVHKRDKPKFDIDPALIPTIFPDIPSPALPEELPEHIHDTFTSTAERKAWYRLSRQGTARLHNFGDDENYRH